ncbi:MAG: MATE family efflux transporter [Treponema brennaborense]|nr:MATE family efflux transporter [Treponema brennaborense]
MTKNLTVGSPMKCIVGFSVPVLFGYLFQQFYAVIDTIIVGRCLGVDALAAVGATNSVNFLIIGFCAGVCGGFAIPVAQKFGAGDYRTMRQFVFGGGVLAVVFSSVMTLCTVLCCRPLLVLMRTPADIIDSACVYIKIIFAGIPACFLYNLLSGIIRAVGDSKTPVLFLVISSLLNIILDLLFILRFRLGVAGAAFATVVSQAFSGAACLVFIHRKFDILRLSADDRKIRTHLFPALCSMGVPMGLQYSITAIGSVILQSSVNSLGSTAVAAVAAADKISVFFCVPFDALGTAMATWGGQHVGAGKLERLKTGLRAAVVLGAGYALFSFFVMLACARPLAAVFLDAPSAELLENARMFLVIVSAFYFLLALVNIIRFLIQGMGFSGFAVLSGAFEMAARTVVGTVFVPVFGFSAVCFAHPAAWVLADIFLIPAFFLCFRKLRNWERAHR